MSAAILSPEDVERLLCAAREARQRAYAPYSHFSVGAAVLTANGEIITGCNVENSSSGLTNCAERVSIQTAIAAGHRDLIAIAVSVPDYASMDAERMTCGACRQVMAEFFKSDATVIVDSVGQFSLSDLLPIPFVLRTP